MAKFLVQKAAAARLREIFVHTQNQWGDEQAHYYIEGMFERFGQIANKQVVWHPIPAEFQVSGYYSLYQKHYIYWKELSLDTIGIVTILHERMHQLARFQEDDG
jgi:toxin ParE1/3/4